MTMRRLSRALSIVAALVGLSGVARSAAAQNDWQFPDPYFGAFQHREAGTPQAERRYRTEIAPQQPHRLHDRRPAVVQPQPGPRWIRHRGRGGR